MGDGGRQRFLYLHVECAVPLVAECLHGHAVERVGAGDGALVVRDEHIFMLQFVHELMQSCMHILVRNIHAFVYACCNGLKHMST